MFRSQSRAGLRLLLSILGCWLAWTVVPLALAQGFDATNLREPAQLDKTWMVHARDDPAYARADFDDSHWMPFDDKNDLSTLMAGARPSIVWYRLHVKVSPQQKGLSIEELNLSEAFEVYANGTKVMQNGSVRPFVPYTYRAYLVSPIPDKEIEKGLVTLAVRVFITPHEWGDPHPGLFASNLTVGQDRGLRDRVWLDILGFESPTWATETLLFGVGLVALALFLAQRSQREYLYTFLFSLSIFSLLPVTVAEVIRNGPFAEQLLVLPFALGEVLFLTLMVYAFLQRRMPRWMWIGIGTDMALVIADNVARYEFLTTNYTLDMLTGVPTSLLLYAVLPILAYAEWRRGNREAGILLIPLLLFGFSSYVDTALALLGTVPALSDWASRNQQRFFAYPAGPFRLSIFHVSELLVVASLTIIIVLRATRTSRQQALLEGELAAAAEVQQIIVPEQVEAVPGFKIESVYLPAQQVGGDFFQVLPAGNGGLLVVVGDVAGKGLPAAMLVSVLVGAIRTAVSYTEDPAGILSELNERLVGRSRGGFSTALVALISADGECRIANAGHLSPYLDGQEVALPGALPLGLVARAEYEMTEFLLPPGSRLTFYSDGVVEAMNAKRELFGFERAQVLSIQPAGAIVEAARKFGQEDDITVITVERTAVIAAAA